MQVQAMTPQLSPQFGLHRRPKDTPSQRTAQPRRGSVTPRTLFTGLLVGVAAVYGALAVSNTRSEPKSGEAMKLVRSVGALENASVSVLALLAAARVAAGTRSKGKPEQGPNVF